MQRKDKREEEVVGNGSKLAIGIVVSDYYAEAVTKNLLAGALAVLAEWQVDPRRVHIIHTPGCFELPSGCLKLLRTKKIDGIITLGCVVRGETDHDKYIASAVAQGLIDLTVKHGIPISLGMLTVNTLEQARVRSTGDNNKGREAARALLMMATVQPTRP